MKKSVLLASLALSLCSTVTTTTVLAVPGPVYHLKVTAVVDAGAGEHPVYLADTTTLSNRVNIPVSQASATNRVVFGLRIDIVNSSGTPVSGEFVLSTAPAYAVSKNCVPYKSGTVTMFNKSLPEYAPTDPTRGTRPDLICYNTAGVRTSGDFVAATTPVTGSTLFIGDHKWALGTDTTLSGSIVPSPHPVMTMAGHNYKVEYTASGTFKTPDMVSPQAFTVTPGDQNLNSAFDYRNYAIAIISDSPISSQGEWINQLKQYVVQRTATHFTQKMIDPSQWAGNAGGYTLAGFEYATDLTNWTFLPNTVVTYGYEMVEGQFERVITLTVENPATMEDRMQFRAKEGSAPCAIQNNNT